MRMRFSNPERLYDFLYSSIDRPESDKSSGDVAIEEGHATAFYRSNPITLLKPLESVQLTTSLINNAYRIVLDISHEDLPNPFSEKTRIFSKKSSIFLNNRSLKFVPTSDDCTGHVVNRKGRESMLGIYHSKSAESMYVVLGVGGTHSRPLQPTSEGFFSDLELAVQIGNMLISTSLKKDSGKLPELVHLELCEL